MICLNGYFKVYRSGAATKGLEPCWFQMGVFNLNAVLYVQRQYLCLKETKNGQNSLAMYSRLEFDTFYYMYPFSFLHLCRAADPTSSSHGLLPHTGLHSQRTHRHSILGVVLAGL